MKKIMFLSLVCIFLQSCGVKLITEDFIYKEGVTFKGERIIDNNIKERGHIKYFAPKGTRYVQLIFIFENKTGTDQTIDPEDIFLLDDNNNKYSIDLVVKGGSIGSYTLKEENLEAGESTKLSLRFENVFPIGSNMRLLIADKIYDLSYSL